MQVKEAYEFFERRYNPEKYKNIKSTLSNFDEGTSTSTSEAKDTPHESIREKNKTSTASTKSKANFEFKHSDKTEMNTDFEETNDYFRNEQLKLDIQKKGYINKFLFTNIPVPRSHRMVGMHI